MLDLRRNGCRGFDGQRPQQRAGVGSGFGEWKVSQRTRLGQAFQQQGAARRVRCQQLDRSRAGCLITGCGTGRTGSGSVGVTA